jgi:hypothetical protein
MLRQRDLRPNDHALRLIKRSIARHRVGKVRHASSWNSRPMTPEKKFPTKSMKGGQKPALNAKSKDHQQHQGHGPLQNHSRNSRNQIVKKKRAKPPTFEEMLRSDEPFHKSKNSQDHQHRKKQPLCRNKLRSKTNGSAPYAKSLTNNRRNGASGTWTRGNNTAKRRTSTGPPRAKVANIARRTQKVGLRAKSAPSSDNKRASRRTQSRAESKTTKATVPLTSTNDSNNKENSLLKLSEEDNVAIHELKDVLNTTHHNFGTIDTTLLDSKRITPEDDATPGGIWGDGVGLDLSTILECSVESQSLASWSKFLSPASQKLMQTNLGGSSNRNEKSNLTLMESVDENGENSMNSGGETVDVNANVSGSSNGRSTKIGVRRSSSFTCGMETYEESDAGSDNEEENQYKNKISPEMLAGGWRVFHCDEDGVKNEDLKTNQQQEHVIFENSKSQADAVSAADCEKENSDLSDDDDHLVELQSTEISRSEFQELLQEGDNKSVVNRDEDAKDEDNDDEYTMDSVSFIRESTEMRSTNVSRESSIMEEDSALRTTSPLLTGRSEPSSVLDEIVEEDHESSNNEYDAESFGDDDYSADEFDSDGEKDYDDDSVIDGIALEMASLKTLAPGEFKNLLGVLRN